MRQRFVLGLVALAVGGLTACGELPPRGVEVGQAAPEYGAVTLAGDSVHLADLRGEVVLLNVWATWCAPCRQEVPALQSLHEEHSADGLRIVGVSVDAAYDREKVRSFADDFGVTYTLWHDPADDVRTRFVITGVPTTMLIDQDGTIVWRHMGPVTADDPGLNAALATTLGTAQS